MRKFFAIMTAVCLLAGTAAWADSDISPAAAALAPGQPAGLKKAQDRDDTIFYVVGIGAVVVGVALLASGGNDKKGTGGGSTSTSTTP